MTEPDRLQRKAARALVVDADERVLLIEGRDSTRPELGSWWMTPGGGLDEGESAAAAARRELMEEIGLAVGELGPVVLHRTVEFPFEQWHIQQEEDFFLVRIADAAPELTPAAWTEIEERTILSHRWWSIADLRTTSETIYPVGLADLLQDNGIGVEPVV